MAVTAFCWSRRCPFIAAAAGPGLGPRPVEAAAEEAGTVGSGPRDGGEGCKVSPAVIQRLLHVGPRRSGHRPWLPCPWPLPQSSFSPRPLAPPLAPSLRFSSPSDCVFHPLCQYCQYSHNALSLSFRSPAVQAAFLPDPWPPCFFLSPLHSYPHDFLFCCLFSITFSLPIFYA